MRAQGITLWRSKRGGRPRGFLRASWREDGKRVTWDTRTLDEGEALGKAAAELSRRRSVPAKPTPEGPPAPAPPTQPGVAPAASSSSSTTTNGVRKPIGEAITRAFTNGAAAAVVPSSSAAAATDDETKAKAKKLYQVFGKCMAYLTEGGLKRACRWAGKEPEEMDDDEEELVREGWEELGADWFGAKQIGPWGKIALGSCVAGVGMYMGGKPIPKPAEPKKLVAVAADGSNVRPERESGGGGG
jgi:hypothetical protein